MQSTTYTPGHSENATEFMARRTIESHGEFVLAPPSDALTAAVAAYTTLQTRNGGDVNAGRKLGTHLTSAGFVNCQMSARYEVYPSLPLIGEYLAIQLERASDSASAATVRSWSRETGGMFAQCWVSCVARSPLK